MGREELLEDFRAEIDEMRKDGRLQLDSEAIRASLVQRAEERIRVVQDLRNSSLVEAYRVIG